MCPCFSNWLKDSVKLARRRKPEKFGKSKKNLPICNWQIANWQIKLAFGVCHILEKRKNKKMSSTDPGGENDSNSSYEEDIEWSPRRRVRDTNWMYRVDALRTRDTREMESYYDLSRQQLMQAMVLLVHVFSIKEFISRVRDVLVQTHLQNLYDRLIQMVHLYHSEAYCNFISYLQIAYYPLRNRITRSSDGPRFPPHSRSSISDLTQNESRQLTGLSRQ